MGLAELDAKEMAIERKRRENPLKQMPTEPFISCRYPILHPKELVDGVIVGGIRHALTEKWVR